MAKVLMHDLACLRYGMKDKSDVRAQNRRQGYPIKQSICIADGLSERQQREEPRSVKGNIIKPMPGHLFYLGQIARIHHVNIVIIRQLRQHLIGGLHLDAGCG